MNEVIHGVVHGRTIRLAEDPGVDDGQAVEVVLRPVSSPGQWGEGLHRCAGSLADYPEMDQDVDAIQKERKLDSRPELPQ